MHKRLCQPNTRKCCIKEDLNQNDDNIIAIPKIFAHINHQYICIHHTKRQTENTLSSCSILNLKTLFKFVSQCYLVPFLESRLCRRDDIIRSVSYSPKHRYIKLPHKQNPFDVMPLYRRACTFNLSLHLMVMLALLPQISLPYSLIYSKQF